MWPIEQLYIELGKLAIHHNFMLPRMIELDQKTFHAYSDIRSTQSVTARNKDPLTFSVNTSNFHSMAFKR